MRCAKQFSITVGEAACDHIGDATWSIIIVDPDPGTVFLFAGGDGTYDFNLTGLAGSQGVEYQALSSTLNCAFNYEATIELDYNVNLTDTGAGSTSTIGWQVWRNGVLLIGEARTAPNGGNLTESGTFSFGPFTMSAAIGYAFLVVIGVNSIGGPALATGALRFRPLVPP